MSLEPQKFFIGIIDFFSILMPGALLTYLAGYLLGYDVIALKEAADWMKFLFASYLLGHFCFLVGSLLDDWAYDRLRQCTYLGQIRRLAAGDAPIDRIWRALATRLFKRNADAAVTTAQRIKARALQAISAGATINTYQWSKARLSKEHPPGLVAVERFEADSKFFRSLVAVLPLLALVHVYQTINAAAYPKSLILALVYLLALLLAFWRYVDQRFKATQQAYWFVIALDGMQAAAEAPAPSGRRLTHAGGIVFRKQGETVEYLLVEASADRSTLVLPKGHLEPGEDPRETAVREVNEETGVWARVVCWLEDLPLPSAPLVRFYLMELAEQTADWAEEERQHRWAPLAQAQKLATFDETRKLLDSADRKRARIEGQKSDGGASQPNSGGVIRTTL